MPSAKNLARETPGPFEVKDFTANERPIVSGDKFTWPVGRKTGITEISDLGLTGFPASLYVRSHKTGKEIMFLRSQPIIVGDDGGPDEEISGYRYFTPGSDISLSIFND